MPRTKYTPIYTPTRKCHYGSGELCSLEMGESFLLANLESERRTIQRDLLRHRKISQKQMDVEALERLDVEAGKWIKKFGSDKRRLREQWMRLV